LAKEKGKPVKSKQKGWNPEGLF